MGPPIVADILLLVETVPNSGKRSLLCMAWTSSKENRMTIAKDMSRRRFVNSAISSAAISCMPIKGLFAGYAESVRTADALRQQTGSDLTDSAAWKDQGVENLQK